MEERFSRLLAQTCWVGCLLGVAATGYFLFGLAGYIDNPMVNFAIVLALAAALFFFSCQFAIAAQGTGRVGWTIWTALLVIIIVEVVLGMLPPTSRDELTHHLAIPKLYVKAGRIVEVPMAPYAYYPMLLDMLYIPWVYWGHDFVPKWIHALFGALTGLLLHAYLARRMNPVYGLLGFFFFLSTPVILRLSHWGYIDLGITFYSTASLLCLLRWREERSQLQWLALSALSLGFALATKPNGWVAALVLACLFALIVVAPPQRNPARILGGAGLFGVLTVVPFLPWLIKNWRQTGNPFYPLLGQLFAGGPSTAGDAVGFAEVGIFARRELLYGENLWQILALPLRIFFSGQDDQPQYFDGVLTPVLMLFLPWAFKGKWLAEKKFLAGFALLFFLYALVLAELRIRYVLVIVPPLVLLLVYGIFNLYLRISRPAYLFALLSCFAVWHGSYLWRYWQAAQPLGYVFGRESRDAYLARMLPDYPAFRFINDRTAPDAKVYLLFAGRRAYYCDREYLHDSGDLPGILLAAIRGAANADQIAQTLRQKRITHLLVREDLLRTFLMTNLTPDQAKLWNQFAVERLSGAFRDRAFSVYQLNG